MKVNDATLMQQGMQQNGLLLEKHDKVPLFIVQPDSVLEGEEQLIIEKYYHETIDGVIYVKMDSTDKNPDGTFSGMEPTYSSDMSYERQKVWADQFTLVLPETFNKLKQTEEVI